MHTLFTFKKEKRKKGEVEQYKKKKKNQVTFKRMVEQKSSADMSKSILMVMLSLRV